MFCFLNWLIGVFQIDENVAREIINHRSLRHPNIIRFKEVCTLFIWYDLLVVPEPESVMFRLFNMWFQFCRWFWLQPIWVLLWSMRLVESSLRGFAVLEDSAKMRSVIFQIKLFKSFQITMFLTQVPFSKVSCLNLVDEKIVVERKKMWLRGEKPTKGGQPNFNWQSR